MKEQPQITRKVFDDNVSANIPVEKSQGFFSKLKNLFG
jgi:hypothetical protein